MLSISALGIAAVATAGYIVLLKTKGKPVSSKLLNNVIYLGSMSFFGGLIWSALGLYQILDYVQRIGDVKLTAIAGGLKASSVPSIWGLFLFLLSYICWYLLQMKKEDN